MIQQLLDAVVLGSIYALFAFGLTLSWGVLDVLNLAHGAIFMLGALGVYLLTKDTSISLPVLIVAAMIGCGVLAVLLERLAYRQIRRRIRQHHEVELTTMIASLAAAALFSAIALMVTHAQPVSLPSTILDIKTVRFLGLQITNLGIIICAATAIVSVALIWFVRSTRHGRAMRALAVDPYVCGLLGVSEDRLSALTMFASGALAGLAGVLLAVQTNAVDAAMGDPFLLKAFAVIILGGVGSVGGAVIGAYALAIIETITFAYIDPSLKEAVAFLLIIALLLVRPQGLFPRAEWRRA